MGNFIVTIKGVGGHGCMRDRKDGDSVLGCQRPDCPDCIAREFVRRYQRNGVSSLEAQILHWPDMDEYGDWPTEAESSVVDDLVTGVRRGSF